MKEKLIRHSILLSVLCSMILASAGIFAGGGHVSGFGEGVLLILLVGCFLVYPAVLTAINLFCLFAGCKDERIIRKGKHFEIITILLGGLYSALLIPFTNIVFSDWTETLYNAQKHTPVWTEGALTVVVLSAVGAAGYLLLSAVHLSQLPPLAAVLAIAAMYLGMIQCVLWIIQIFQRDLFYIYLCLFPANCILIGIKTIRQKILEWERIREEDSDGDGTVRTFRNRRLQWLNEKLYRSASWPIAAFLLMWPLLAVIVCILLLFGQQPDSAIRAWTETSDWNLSRQTAPQNLYYDEHYLCTVAAGGHRRVVKPIRMGVRHGHPVIVNRQLCIANAFEQILEERMPKIHRRIRHFYDTYGFPVARLIHSPYMADLVYILMKPLEWLFLAVIYAVDRKPENRIAVQYLAKSEKSGYNK